jgi:DNA-binding response OmpR family regulator
LGLATVYGIVKQNGGNVQVYSEKGIGTTFKIYLPCIDGTAPARTRLEIEAKLLTGTETILVVEDDAHLRYLIRQVLLNLGYTVLDAPDGDKALQLVPEHNGPIDLLLTDVVMPGMSGKSLAEKLVQLRPGLKILFMSGYTENAIARHSVLGPGIEFIQKPFSLTAIAARIREVLARSGDRWQNQQNQR